MATTGEDKSVINLTSLLIERELSKSQTILILKIKESVIESSMIEPLNKYWPEWLKDERDYRLVSSYRQGYGHKFPGMPSAEELYLTSHELAWIVSDVNISIWFRNESNCKEWDEKEDIANHFMSYYSLKQPRCSNYDGNLTRVMELMKGRDLCLVQAYKSRKSGIPRNPGYIHNVDSCEREMERAMERKRENSRFFVNIDDIHQSHPRLFIYPYHTDQWLGILLWRLKRNEIS